MHSSLLNISGKVKIQLKSRLNRSVGLFLLNKHASVTYRVAAKPAWEWLMQFSGPEA